MVNKTALVLGAGGFIGSHLVERLKKEGWWVRGVDLKFPLYEPTSADDFVIGDLRSQDVCDRVIDRQFDQVFQLAADMGGAGYIFTGENDADIMHNSATINLNVAEACRKRNIKNVFYSSSACMYPEHNQLDPNNITTEESSAYPANPDSEYGWEKLFSERLYLAYNKNYGMNCKVARFHNIYGPKGSWNNGREKVPAAMCRKIALAEQGGTIDVWGDGEQTRSFLYIDDCLDAVMSLCEKDGFNGPVNIGSEEMVTINKLVEVVDGRAGKKVKINHIDGPQGVRGRNSHNDLIRKELGWEPKFTLVAGINITYNWIENQIKKNIKDK